MNFFKKMINLLFSKSKKHEIIITVVTILVSRKDYGLFREESDKD
tara:strand:+ start:146 stop:280 length:135 start_codon:yes stop_codon:yes gene_type:complete